MKRPPVSELTTIQNGIVCELPDLWSRTDESIPDLNITNVAADLTLPNVVIPAAWIPTDVTLHSVFPLLKWRKMSEDSTAVNYLDAAAKGFRVKPSTAAWLGGSALGLPLTNGGWYVGASAVEGGNVLVGIDIKSLIVIANGVTYNFAGDETNNGDSPVVHADGVDLFDVETGFRISYLLT